MLQGAACAPHPQRSLGTLAFLGRREIVLLPGVPEADWPLYRTIRDGDHSRGVIFWFFFLVSLE